MSLPDLVTLRSLAWLPGFLTPTTRLQETVWHVNVFPNRCLKNLPGNGHIHTFSSERKKKNVSKQTVALKGLAGRTENKTGVVLCCVEFSHSFKFFHRALYCHQPSYFSQAGDKFGENHCGLQSYQYHSLEQPLLTLCFTVTRPFHLNRRALTEMMKHCEK